MQKAVSAHGMKSMENIPVLVVIPLYNARPYIAQTVQSILTQTYPHFRLLVIDDGSTDGGDEVVSQIAYDRIILWHQTNRGPGSTMNRAIEFAQKNDFPFIARLDSDDIALPNRLEAQVKLLASTSPNVAACSSNCYYIDDKTQQVIGRSTVPIRSPLIKWEIQNGLRGLIQGALLARTEALSSIGGYRKQFLLAEESDLFLRLAERFNFTNSPDYLCKIRFRQNSLSIQGADHNIWYSLYALDCMKRRRRSQAEQTYAEFRRSVSAGVRFRYGRERWLLRHWRASMTHPNPFSLLLAGFIDPRRVLSRLLRSLDAWLARRT